MNTLIIPCCGRNFIFHKPRWLLPYPPNDILLSACLKMLGKQNYDRIIVTILDSDLKLISIEQLNKYIGNSIEICVLENETVGPADTIYETIVKKQINGSIEIKDIDILFERPVISHQNFVTGIHLLDYDSDLKSVRNKSFITRNEQNSILDIIEKTIKSDIISMGLYGFSSAEKFCEAYKILKRNFSLDERIYVSHIIAYLIGVNNIIFNYIEIDRYISIEQEKDYEKLIRCMGTYFFDSTKMDIEQNISQLLFMEKKGANIFFLVDQSSLKSVKSILKSYGIKGKVILLTSTYSQLISSEEGMKEAFLNVY